MASTICYRRATRTSASVRTTFVEGATVQNAVYTIPARSVLVPYTTSTCVTRLATRVCGSYVTSRYSISPGELGFQDSIYNLTLVFSPSVDDSSYPSRSKNIVYHKLCNAVLNIMHG